LEHELYLLRGERCHLRRERRGGECEACSGVVCLCWSVCLGEAVRVWKGVWEGRWEHGATHTRTRTRHNGSGVSNDRWGREFPLVEDPHPKEEVRCADTGEVEVVEELDVVREGVAREQGDDVEFAPGVVVFGAGAPGKDEAVATVGCVCLSLDFGDEKWDVCEKKT
jgi:hypothetical protein